MIDVDDGRFFLIFQRGNFKEIKILTAVSREEGKAIFNKSCDKIIFLV